MKKIKFKIMGWEKDLFPLCRSLTGEQNRKTLKYIKNINNKFQLKSFKSGQHVYDWKIPKEWWIKDAYIKDSNQKKILDFKKNNLHLLNYSLPIKKKINLDNLKKNIFTNKQKPKIIPYVTSYYKKRWGFGMSYNQLKKMKKKEIYNILIDSGHFNGRMDYAEMTLKGRSKKFILICSYICHPSMANNELSGPLVVTALSKMLKKSKYTVKLLLIPETIGAIAYINKNINHLRNNLVAGFNLSCVGDKSRFSLISSLNENTYSDKIAYRVLEKNFKFKKFSFLKRGSNERQFGCQNLNLPFVTICRSRFGDYPEYHTSKDNLNLINEKNLMESSFLIKKIVDEIQQNSVYIKQTICEPFLTKYNLVNLIGGPKKSKFFEDIQNVIAYCGRDYDLKELSKKLNITKKEIKKLIYILKKKKILKEFI